VPDIKKITPNINIANPTQTLSLDRIIKTTETTKRRKLINTRLAFLSDNTSFSLFTPEYKDRNYIKLSGIIQRIIKNNKKLQK
jgi:hypothetical protein